MASIPLTPSRPFGGIPIPCFFRNMISSAHSTGNPGIFYQKIIEIFIIVNGQGQFLPEGPGGGKGEPGVPPIINMYLVIIFNDPQNFISNIARTTA